MLPLTRTKLSGIRLKKKKKMEEYTKEMSKTGNASYEVREEKGLHIGSTQIFTGAYLTPVIRHVECSFLATEYDVEILLLVLR